jgi:putative ABC transport system substrate-binding protein
MRRRDFIKAIGGVAVIWPLAARAQQPDLMQRIGVLADGPKASRQRPLEAFMARLRDFDWADGRNLAVEYRSADGRTDRFPELAAELVGLKVDVIVALGTPAALAAKQATAGVIPIVASVGDAIGSGLVSSLARPSGNITGASDLTAELSGKRLEILKEAVPDLARLAVLWNAANPGAARTWKETRTAAKTLGLEIHSAAIHDADQLDQLIANAALALRVRVGSALLVAQDPLTLTYRDRIVTLVAKSRLPAMYGFREFVEAGGLLSYAADLVDVYRMLATYVDKVLRGVPSADLPVVQPTKFELVINLKTAKALGLTVPSTLLARADEVIE